MLLIRNEKKNRYISTREFELWSGFTLITMAFHKFSLCNTKHMLLSLKVFYIHTHKNKVMLFLMINEK
jgi:hypothetical protein